MSAADPVTMWVSFGVIVAGLILAHTPIIRVLPTRRDRSGRP